MAALFGNNYTANVAAGTEQAQANVYRGRVRHIQQVITLAAQAAGDTIALGKLPKGAVFLAGLLNASATLGASATIAIGITGSTGKYRAAATFTTADTPTLFGVNAGVGAELTAEEEVIITIAVAALPGSGRLVVDLFYAID